MIFYIDVYYMYRYVFIFCGASAFLRDKRIVC